MSFPHSKRGATGTSIAESVATNETSNAASRNSADNVIDAALRSVPLPEGLLSRLKQVVLSIPDDSAGRVDYLGC